MRLSITKKLLHWYFFFKLEKQLSYYWVSEILKNPGNMTFILL